MYEVQHSHILQIEASCPASVLSLLVNSGCYDPLEEIFKILFTEHPQYHRLEFTVQHYTTVTEYFMWFLDTP